MSRQRVLPNELILVDGAPEEETATWEIVRSRLDAYPFRIVYIRHGGGTAIQRNVGIDAASGRFIAFIDDDVRLDEDFFDVILKAFEDDRQANLGGIVGYRRNMHFALNERKRWRWYKRLRLLTTYVPGEYDFQCGYPINAGMQPPFEGLRKVQYMTTACAVWRREVFEGGLRFDPFFCDYGVLEDAHFSLRAGRDWELAQCGGAQCIELHAPGGRPNRKRLGFKYVVNPYYIFQDLVRPLTWRHRLRFWRFQAFELFRIVASAVRRRRYDDLLEVQGRVEGILAILRGVAP
jgi:glycosyltransferase involved in cell wall biosynthesis